RTYRSSAILLLPCSLLLSACFCPCAYPAANPRHRASFPTRRSSDLAARGVCARARADLVDLPLERRHRARNGTAARWRLSSGKSDRKSTRLNSSHEWISYAVFCLKKKNTNADCMMRRTLEQIARRIG